MRSETLFKIAASRRRNTEIYFASAFYLSDSSTIRHYLHKAGIEAVPTTWEEFDAACKKLKDAGITPITGDTTYQTSTWDII